MNTTTAKISPNDSITIFYRSRFEAFRINHSNAMAITLCPKKTDFVIPWRQHHKYGYHYHKILQKSCHFMFVPEFRINDNSIHYHGYIAPFNLLAYKSRTLSSLKRLGFFNIKTNVDINWSTYCVKETNVTQPLINQYFLNCGPYMYYNNIKKLFTDEDKRLSNLALNSKNAINVQAKQVKKESDNIKLHFNFQQIFN